MASLLVEVDDGTGSFVQVNADRAKITKRVGPGQADFRIPDASLADRNLCQPGREVHVTLTVGSEAVTFGGYVGKPRVIVDAPQHFSLQVEVVALNYGASLKMVFIQPFPNPPTRYTDMLDTLWAGYWPEVDRSGIQVDARDTDEEMTFVYGDLARFTNRICRQLLGDYVWWVEWAGLTRVLRAGRYNYNLTGKTINEMDIGWSYELAPQDWDYRSEIHVVGGDGGGPDPSDPGGGGYGDYFAVYGKYPSVPPADPRPILIHDPNVATNEQAAQRAWGEHWRRRLRHKVRFALQDYSLVPGNVVTLNLPTIGVNNEAYSVEQTEDTYERGRVEREVELQEVL
jgi:hypothetical protein